MLKKLILNVYVRRVLDILLFPITIIGSLWFRYIRSRSVVNMPLAKYVFLKVGVYPIADHYYEPLFNFKKHLIEPLQKDRHLPAIDLNEKEQINLIKKFSYNEELKDFPVRSNIPLTYHYQNPSYGAGDAEILYNMVRHFKPKRIVEVGCGFSTLMIQNGLRKNKEEGFKTHHICVEPYEMPWLEQLPISIIRNKVETLDHSFFHQLEDNDFLFIDSSHMIRPQGDVLYEFLELLPQLKKGVIVHVHDIYTPKDYPKRWLYDLNRFWNEQYLLEAFLSNNSTYKVILAANYLVHHYKEELLAVCPIMAEKDEKEPASFWIQRI